MQTYTHDTYYNCYYVPPINYPYPSILPNTIINNNKIVNNSSCHTLHSIDVSANLDYNIAYELPGSSKIIYITYWPYSYGHLIDDLYSLYRIFYYNNYHTNGYKILLAIPLDNTNVLDLAKFLFNDNLINAFTLPQDKLIKIHECKLFNHTPECENFLLFNDIYLTQKIKDYYNDATIDSEMNVFITRGETNEHAKKRALSNMDYITTFFKEHKIAIINPEVISDKELYNKIKNARNIIITNGSALSSLVISNRKTKVFCINSAGYLPEWRRAVQTQKELDNLLREKPHILNDNFEKNLWKKFTSQFDFTYIDSFNNSISAEQLNYILESFIMH